MRNLTFLLGVNKKKYIAVTVMNAILSGAEVVLHPLMMKAIFDSVARGDNYREFVFISLGYLIIGIILNLSNFSMSLWKTRVDNKIVSEVSVGMLRAYFRKNLGYVLEKGDGHFISIIRSDVKDGLVQALEAVRNIVAGALSFVLLIIVLLAMSWKAFIAISVIIPVAALVSSKFSKEIKSITLIERDMEGGLLNVISKAVGAYKIINGFNILEDVVSKFDGALNQVIGASYKKTRQINALQGGRDLVMVISDFFSIFVGAYFVFKKSLTLGSFVSFMNAFWRSTTTLMNIFKQVSELHAYIVIVDRLAAFLEDQPELAYHEVGHAVHARGMKYAFGEEAIISDFSFDAAPGERILVVGPNGSGKTTLANILSGYLRPSAGVLQLPEKVSSITLPVNFPCLEVDKLPLDDKILDELGMGNQIGPNTWPDQLSAGQRQKLALAMALTQDADLYVLDEPTANLDVKSRLSAMNQIMSKTKDKILVAIMHDAEEYLPLFDKVYRIGQ